MLPKHGKIECRLCFSSSDASVHKLNSNWKMVNDPGAWGGGDCPDYLVLGFSMGATLAGIYESSRFEDVAFAGMRPRLTEALRAIGALSSRETSDEKISDQYSNISFGSLIRCSVSRIDIIATAKAGREVYACTGPLITKSFKEIPEVISICTRKFLADLPRSIQAVFLLGNTDSYVTSCQSVLRGLFPTDFRQVNPMAVVADGRIWIHIAHPSGLNGHFKTWLNGSAGPGLKRLQAKAAAEAYNQPLQPTVSGND